MDRINKACGIKFCVDLSATPFYIKGSGFPFLLIPYEYEGVQHHYDPDYILRMKSGKTAVLEMKDEESDQDRAKHQAARRWITAVNNWGRLGVWDFLVCRDPQMLPKLFAEEKIEISLYFWS